MLASAYGKLHEREFRRIVAIVRERAGIELNDSKRQLCQTRLIRRLRALQLASFSEYLQLFDDASSPEYGELINAITTNVTAFYREAHHFQLLAELLPTFAARRKRIRLWSAGCSTGEEPWTLAMTVREALGDGQGLDVKILATDIDTNVLAHAEAGIYDDEDVEPVGRARLLRFFHRGTGASSGRWRVADELRSLVAFRPLNLFAPWPMTGRFDIIMCRNVMIYFDADNKAALLKRYRELLWPDGYMFLGHSESVTAGVGGFHLAGRTAYRKAA